MFELRYDHANDHRASVEGVISAMQLGNLVVAERLVREYLQHETANENGLILLGTCLTRQSRIAEAITVLRDLAELKPTSAVHWSNLGTALRSAGEVREAEQAYRRATQLDSDFADAHLDLGYLLLESGRYLEARNSFMAAHAVDPASPEARIYAAKTCVALDDRELASRLIAPRHGWVELSDALTLELASLMTAIGAADEGVRIYEGFLRKSPDNPCALANLVILYERINRLDDARKMSRRLPPAESIDDPELSYDVNTACATIAQREADIAHAQKLLENLIASFNRSAESRHMPWRAGHLYSALAKVQDRSGDVDGAMESLKKAHACQLTLARQAVPELLTPDAPPLYMGTQRVTPEDRATWLDHPAPAIKNSPVFVVGFPRSGTTMLEQMLDAHPDLVSMDERAFLHHLIERMGDFGYAYPQDLGKLSAKQCEELRQQYWHEAASVAACNRGQRLVDKNPLHMLLLPLINRLFPNSPIILALRHPCDVILSNYMQYFTSNSFAVLCSSLERLAQGYVNAMNFWIYHADLLKPNVVSSRYEDLLDDFTGNVARIGDFLGLEDTAQMEHFDRRARDKGFISTPSYTRVIEPPNKDAVNRWRRYEEYFEPILPTLRPIMQHWGYDA